MLYQLSPANQLSRANKLYDLTLKFQQIQVLVYHNQILNSHGRNEGGSRDTVSQGNETNGNTLNTVQIL
jgi:hypothetical protein